MRGGAGKEGGGGAISLPLKINRLSYLAWHDEAETSDSIVVSIEHASLEGEVAGRSSTATKAATVAFKG